MRLQRISFFCLMCLMNWIFWKKASRDLVKSEVFNF